VASNGKAIVNYVRLLHRYHMYVELALACLGLERPVVEVTAVERLQRDPGPAKLRRFVPLGGPLSGPGGSDIASDPRRPG
jgi:hypothetical protein